MLRLLDIVLSGFGLIVSFPVMVLVAILIRRDSPGPVLFVQPRVGKNERPFICYKFRTMQTGTPQLASHLVDAHRMTKIGSILRRTKLDELPQLWNVLRGEMSLVGPRPNLPTQTELIQCRRLLGIYDFRPGITGIAQIHDIDMSDPHRLAETDRTYKPSLTSYFSILIATVIGRGQGDRVHQ